MSACAIPSAPHLNPLEDARNRYIRALQRVHPGVDAQLSDIVRLVDALLDPESPPVAGPLGAARAAYLARVRQTYRSPREQVRDLARACADLYAQSLGLPAAVAQRPSH